MNKERVELHLHTNMSTMDGINTIGEYIAEGLKDWMPAIVVTDHAGVQAFPEAFREQQRSGGIKLIYGMEAYMVNDKEQIVSCTSDMDLDSTFVVVDIETTGLNPRTDKITEIAAYKVAKGEIVDKFSALVNPEINISQDIADLTGITNEMVRNAEKIDSVFDKFLKFVDDAIIVAHNASFDISFLKTSAKQLNIEFSPTTLDTLTLSRGLMPNLLRYKLDVICKELNIELKKHHRASDDAEATAMIFIKLCEMLKTKGVSRISDIESAIQPYYKGIYRHASILVKDKEGLKNLYKLVSLANTKYFYKVPRTPKSEIEKHRKGLLIGSGCDSGELYNAVRERKTFEELSLIAEFYDYLEVVPTSNFKYYIDCGHADNEQDLIEINKTIVELGKKINKPVVAVSDAHYIYSEDELCRKILMHHKGYDDYNNQPNLRMRTTKEMLQEFSYLDDETAMQIVVENTNRIADMVEDTFSPIDECAEYVGDFDKLKGLTYAGAYKYYGNNLPAQVVERIEWELNILKENSRSVYNYLLCADLVEKAEMKGYVVGTRGSVASSLVAYLIGITEINPLEAHYICPRCNFVEFHNEYSCGVDMPDKKCPQCDVDLVKDGFTIPAETFLGLDGERDVDIDLNFAPEYQSEAKKNLRDYVGGETINAGTIGTVGQRFAYRMIEKYCREEKLKLTDNTEIELAERISRVKKTTGIHPGGVVIVPNDRTMYDYTPIQYPAGNENTECLTSHFDFYSLIHLLKVDILAHDDPAMLKMLENMTGVSLRDIPLDDKETMELLTKGSTLGISEFKAPFVRNQMIPQIKPKTFDDLIRISAASHGTDVWTDNADVIVENGIPFSETVSARDDVMLYLIKNEFDRNEAYKISERLRKGKGLTEEQYDDLLERGVEQWRLDSWNKIRYSFPRAHAANYVLMAYRIAYFKAHYPLEFYCAFFSVNSYLFNADVLINEKGELKQRIEDMADETEYGCDSKFMMMQVCQEMYDKGFDFVSDKIKNESFEGFFIEDGKLRPKLKNN